jgi:hypothetical protein
VENLRQGNQMAIILVVPPAMLLPMSAALFVASTQQEISPGARLC